MCGSGGPIAQLKCIGIWLVVLGVFAGPTSPAGLCGIIMGSMMCCCAGTDEAMMKNAGCFKCGSTVGVILAIIQGVGCIGVGVFLITNVDKLCNVATGVITSSSAGACGRRLEEQKPPLTYLLTPPPSFKWPTDETLAKYRVSPMAASAIYLIGGQEATDIFNTTVPKLIAAGPAHLHATTAKTVAKTVAKTDLEPSNRRALYSSSLTDIDSCGHANSAASDGDCDDGGPGSEFSSCTLGHDCTDCGPRSGSSCNPFTDVDNCNAASDGDCDDGGPGSEFSDCALGHDCTDCGPRSGSACNSFTFASSGSSSGSSGSSGSSSGSSFYTPPSACSQITGSVSVVRAVCNIYKTFGYILCGWSAVDFGLALCFIMTCVAAGKMDKSVIPQ